MFPASIFIYPGGFPFFPNAVYLAPDTTTDRTCFDRLIVAFRSLNLFNSVVFSSKAPVSESFPSLWLQPWKWKEDDDDDFDVRLRTVWFRINLRVQTQSILDTSDPFDQLESLSAAVANAMDRITDPPWYGGQSGISEGLYPLDGATDKTNLPKPSPVSGATLIGKIVYEVERGRRETE